MSKLNVKQILANEDDPDGLENLYWSDSEAFKVALLSAAVQKPDSKAFQVWRARLEYNSSVENPSGVPIVVVLLLATFFGLLVRIPETFLTETWYYPRFGPFFTLLSVATYFLYKNPNFKLSVGLSIFSILTSIYLILIPDWQSFGKADWHSDSITMALIHLPLTTLILLGICFVQQSWQDTKQRIAFVKFCGELLMLSTLILISGGVLSGLTVGFFELMNMDIVEWYMSNIGVIGIVSTPLVATYLYDSVLHRKMQIAVLLAKVFSPLFFIFVLSYIIAMMILGNSPFVNREFLVGCNGLLILILGIMVFSIATRSRDSKIIITDYINVLLVGATLLINSLALSAIIFRLVEYGFTPNRFCVLGANLIVFVHLISIMVAYIQVIRQKIDFDLLRKKVVSYFPAYACWFVFITYLLPLIFDFV